MPGEDRGLTVEENGWRKYAACVGTSPEAFFPPHRDVSGIEYARNFCRTWCLVIEKCLENTMAIEDGLGRQTRFGVFGGLSSGQRYELYRERLKAAGKTPSDEVAPCGTYGAYQRHLAAGESACDECREACRKKSKDLRALRRASA